jgi:hypothetical protein
VGDAHPVERSIGRALRRIQVEVPIDVHQAGLDADLAQPGAHAQGDRAVAAHDQQAVISRQQRRNRFGESPKGRHDLIEILCITMCAVRRPCLHREVTGVVHLVTDRGKPRQQTRLSKRPRGLFLPDRVTSGAAGDPDNVQHRHGRDHRPASFDRSSDAFSS